MSHLLSITGLRGQVANLEMRVTELTDGQSELYTACMEIFVGHKFAVDTGNWPSIRQIFANV